MTARTARGARAQRHWNVSDAFEALHFSYNQTEALTTHWYRALHSNTNGESDSAFGNQSLTDNTSGILNGALLTLR